MYECTDFGYDCVFATKYAVNNPDLRLMSQRSELVKAYVDQPKFFENYVVYVITPMNDALVRGTVQAL